MRFIDPVPALLGVLTGPASTKVPNPRPARWSRLVPSGGVVQEGGLYTTARYAVESWGNSDADASNLSLENLSAILAWEKTDSATLSGIEYDYPVSYPDPDSDQDRYVFFIAGILLSEE